VTFLENKELKALYRQKRIDNTVVGKVVDKIDGAIIGEGVPSRGVGHLRSILFLIMKL